MAAANDDKRKKKVIHTRVDESLEESLREKAEVLGMSVSNLVRNVLVNALDLVEDAIADTHHVARTARGEPVATGPSNTADLGPEPGTVLGWQHVVLNLNAICAQCNTILPRGREAAIGLMGGGSSAMPPVLCQTCMKEMRHDDSSDDSAES